MTQGLLKDWKKMNRSSRTRQALCEAMWTLPMDDLTSNIAVSVCSRRSCSLSSLGIYSPWVRQPNLSRLTTHDMSRRPSHVGNVQTCSWNKSSMSKTCRVGSRSLCRSRKDISSESCLTLVWKGGPIHLNRASNAKRLLSSSQSGVGKHEKRRLDMFGWGLRVYLCFWQELEGDVQGKLIYLQDIYI